MEKVRSQPAQSEVSGWPSGSVDKGQLRCAAAGWPATPEGSRLQDCRRSPGIVCRLAEASRTPQWDALLQVRETT